jgi:hypothetical protein
MAKLRKSSRTLSPEKRARSLVRDAVKRASRLSIRILEDGRSSLTPAKRAQVAKRAEKTQVAKASRAFTARAARGVSTTAGKADITAQLQESAPAFGDVLRSIGHAVAVTQTALDDTALESLKALAGQQVQVPVLIEQNLNDDGTPDTTPGGVVITSVPMPLTSIINPSMQQVNQMTLRMDMRVQSFDATSGIKFNQNIASAGVSYSRGNFGFAMSMANTNVNAQFSNMSDFASGSVMMSMDIGDRTGFQIPTPLEYGIGASLLVRLKKVSQVTVPGATADDPAVTTRTAEILVKRVSKDGSVSDLDDGEYEVTVPPGLLFDTATKGTLKISRDCSKADPYLERKIPVMLGQLNKEVTVYI